MNKAVRSMEKQNTETLRGALLSAVLAVVFSLIFYTCNTPLGAWIGSDNAMYLTMGTALANGYVPYSDIFDHKGPLLFVLQAIPQLFTSGYSTLAVFVQEVLFLWAGLLVIARMARRLGVKAIAVQLLYLAVYAPLVDGGNLTEEYCNLFTLFGLDVMLGVFGDGLGSGKEKTLLMPALLMGGASMLCFLTRANNALPLVGAVGALALYLIFTKRWQGLGLCAAGYVLGLAAIALPVALWLMMQGALSDAIYGAFKHNLMYAETNGSSRIQMLLFRSYGHRAMLLAAISCLGALLCAVRTRRYALPMAMVLGAACGGFAGFISHKFYLHYLMVGAPMAALGAAQIFAFVRERMTQKLDMITKAAAAVSVLALIVTGVPVNAQREADYAVMQQLTPQAQALYAQVPEEDHDSFMAYRVEPKWYVAAKALPCMRFYFLQEILADADPAIMDEIVAGFEQDPPKWVVIYYNREFGPPYDARVQEIFNTRYAFVDALGEYQLLRLKETL